MERGTIIGGRYQLVDPVADGGLATVWQGVDRQTEVPVAVKVMKRAFTAVGGHQLELFIEEARIGAQLEHANLVHVRDFVVEKTNEGQLYCQVMEWIDGIDLRRLIAFERKAGREITPELAATIGIGVLHGLIAAHERRLAGGIMSPVIHRDVAPQNILLGADGAIKLGDFGMARARDRIAERTAPGVVKGTLAYVAPECLKGEPPAARSDVYSLGVTLWETLSGVRMFESASHVVLIDKIRVGAIEPLAEHRPELPPRVLAAVHRALSTDPAKRFPDARAMATELSELLVELGAGDQPALVGDAVTRAMA